MLNAQNEVVGRGGGGEGGRKKKKEAYKITTNCAEMIFEHFNDQ